MSRPVTVLAVAALSLLTSQLCVRADPAEPRGPANAATLAQANAQQVTAEKPVGVSHPSIPHLSAGDEKAIRDILKDQEAAWNQHDMKAFTKAFRDDVEGINVAGM